MTVNPLNTPNKNPNGEKNAKLKINELMSAVNADGTDWDEEATRALMNDTSGIRPSGS